MKKVRKKLLLIALSISMLAGCSKANINYDGSLLARSFEITRELGYDTENNPFSNGERFFEVIKESENEFSVNVNGTEMHIQIPAGTQETSYVPKEVNDISLKYKEIIAKSKKLIYQYIDASAILYDKDGIKKYIDMIGIQESSFDDDIVAYFSYTDDCIYINRNNLDFICEWMIVHEYIHAISYYTHNFSIEEEEYAFNLFNEVVTDIITATLEPMIVSDMQSGYYMYFGLIYPYINLFGKDAIEAYFYGYDKIYGYVSRDEFEFFVLVIENYGEENSDVYFNNLMLKWYSSQQ